jgi:acyl carrier protein
VGSETHSPAVIEAVTAALDEVVGISFTEDDLDRELAETGIDSLDLIEIVMVVEESMGISAKEADFEGVKTLRDAVKAFERQESGVE